jgi:cbb3-type cytochrome oxidase subunit 3
MKNQNKKIKFIYAIGLLVLLIIFFVSYSKYKMEKETQSSGETVKVLISKVSCSSYGSNKSYIVFHHSNSNHIVNVENKFCENYKVGDSLNLLYNKEYDLFFTNEIDTTNEKWGMILSGIFFLLIVLNLLFPKIVKLPGQ